MNRPLVSIVTISFNQAEFLEQTILSVLDQDYPHIEYIVVDPGSTDGSREIIERYRDRIAHIIYERDNGPADGLNKGFARASGEIYGFLNSDDILLPGALSKAVTYLAKHPAKDVVSGHALIIDRDGKILRKAYSDKFSLVRYAYGSVVLMQPSTFFRRTAFEKSGGFNAGNRSSWDGELWVEMALNGARFVVANEFLSGFRLHSLSITASKRLEEESRSQSKKIFYKVVWREKTAFDKILALFFRLYRYASNPRDIYERLTKGPIYGRTG